MALKNEYILKFSSKGVRKTDQDVNKLDKSTNKLSSSQKNAIKKMLKNPEDIHMIKRDGQNVNKVLKALKWLN